jgi:hypothetical protein
VAQMATQGARGSIGVAGSDGVKDPAVFDL